MGTKNIELYRKYQCLKILGYNKKMLGCLYSANYLQVKHIVSSFHDSQRPYLSNCEQDLPRTTLFV